MVTTRELVLSRRPRGRIEPDCFTLLERKLPPLQPGQLLVRAGCFSVDPSMIPRFSADTYAPAFGLGVAVEARAVSQVVQSAADGWSEGDWALCWGGWRDYAIIDASDGIHIQPRSGLPPHTWLHVLGVPGLTAYVGLVDVAQLQPGARVWVSAAAGAVGSVAAQLAKARGASLVLRTSFTAMPVGGRRTSWAVVRYCPWSSSADTARTTRDYPGPGNPGDQRRNPVPRAT
jgi:NADPH-dependent curcumin reductase CurA